jgi:hypothetical protein
MADPCQHPSPLSIFFPLSLPNSRREHRHQKFSATGKFLPDKAHPLSTRSHPGLPNCPEQLPIYHMCRVAPLSVLSMIRVRLVAAWAGPMCLWSMIEKLKSSFAPGQG